MNYVRTKFDMFISNGFFVITMKPKAKYRFNSHHFVFKYPDKISYQ
jgi:hypothetical protein